MVAPCLLQAAWAAAAAALAAAAGHEASRDELVSWAAGLRCKTAWAPTHPCCVAPGLLPAPATACAAARRRTEPLRQALAAAGPGSPPAASAFVAAGQHPPHACSVPASQVHPWTAELNGVAAAAVRLATSMSPALQTRRQRWKRPATLLLAPRLPLALVLLMPPQRLPQRPCRLLPLLVPFWRCAAVCQPSASFLC